MVVRRLVVVRCGCMEDAAWSIVVLVQCQPQPPLNPLMAYYRTGKRFTTAPMVAHKTLLDCRVSSCQGMVDCIERAKGRTGSYTAVCMTSQ